MANRSSVGGQAVIEGVMMRGTKGIATAVRLEDGSIEVDVKESVPLTKKNKLLGLPVIRGFISLFESLIVGIKSLNYSAAFFEEETEPSKFDEWFKGVFKEKTNDIIIGFALVVSLVFSVLIFFILPTFLANLCYKLGMGKLGVNIVEGILRVAIFLMYIYLIGKMEDINRVYQYHGAEHKTIFCYENEKELTPENAKEFGRLHPRCGTNFLFIVMLVSIILFSLLEFNVLWKKVLYRIVILPLVAGISYEVIRWMGKSEGSLSKIISYPGLKLQMLTTREPDYSQLQVAIVSLKAAEGLDYSEDIVKYSNKKDEEIEEEDASIGDLLNKGNEILKAEGIDSYIIDCQLLLAKVLNRDKLSIITNRDEVVSKDKATEFYELINKRKAKMPVKYILEQCEFMGIDLFVKEGVLIPRPDTEILVEETLKLIKEKGYSKLCDLCSGSGAIGLAIASINPDVTVSCIDISEVAEEVTKTNIDRLNLQSRVSFSRGDLLQEVISEGKVFDAIISNPPYIREDVIPELMEDVKNYEPRLALSGGEDGLDFYRSITEQALKCLKEGGALAFEIGYDQKSDVEQILLAAGFVNVECIKDLAGNDRVVKGIKAC